MKQKCIEQEQDSRRSETTLIRLKLNTSIFFPLSTPDGAPIIYATNFTVAVLKAFVFEKSHVHWWKVNIKFYFEIDFSTYEICKTMIMNRYHNST